MDFRELIASAQVSARDVAGEADVSSVAIDSRLCEEGTCFVAQVGSASDGHAFIDNAIESGAVAVVCQEASGVPPGTASAVVDDPRAAAGQLAQALLDWPARKLTTVAVTGTNGKTTVAHITRSLLERLGHPTGLLGTIAYETGLREHPAGTTTPDPVSLAEMTAEMVQAGRTHLVMEASSHALDQERVAGMDFAVGVFTNLSGDHLDYHGDMDAYRAAKRKLFERLDARASAVINADDPAGEDMARVTRATTMRFGLSPLADLRARIHELTAEGCQFDLIGPGGEATVELPLIGRHNVYNALAAAGAALCVGAELADVAEALETIGPVPGRLERVAVERPTIYVDYAHTDDALTNVLSALRPLVAGQLIVVFGAGGDRDRTKRPRMAAAAERLADRVILTSDNPRTEDPRAIIEEIAAGFGPAGLAKAEQIVDRREAIGRAIELAGDADVVLIAGKGHETYQVVGETRLVFSDAAVAEELAKSTRTR
jgi:UDP-N-acetylmuramoyl-L-alanyl-D-glutamate--2,6-diaminopimelate ligase